MIQNNEDLEKHLLCWAIVGTMSETGDAAKFSLGRKINEYIKELELSIKDERKALISLFILSGSASQKTVTKNTKKACYKIVSLLVNSNYASLLSGANTFDNVAWFNKEISDESINLITALLLLSTDKEEVITDIFKLYKTLMDAKLKAAYKCELFLKPFVPEEKKVVAKKTTTKKATKKTSSKKDIEKKSSKKESDKKDTKKNSKKEKSKK